MSFFEGILFAFSIGWGLYAYANLQTKQQEIDKEKQKNSESKKYIDKLKEIISNKEIDIEYLRKELFFYRGFSHLEDWAYDYCKWRIFFLTLEYNIHSKSEEGIWKLLTSDQDREKEICQGIKDPDLDLLRSGQKITKKQKEEMISFMEIYRSLSFEELRNRILEDYYYAYHDLQNVIIFAHKEDEDHYLVAQKKEDKSFVMLSLTRKYFSSLNTFSQEHYLNLINQNPSPRIGILLNKDKV